LQKLSPGFREKLHCLLVVKGIPQPVGRNLAILVLEEETAVSLSRLRIFSAFVALELLAGRVVGANIDRKPR
jgi:hypothetical protein